MTNNILESQIIENLRQVFDPEIPVNIYDIGLIYGIDIDSENSVNITLTLTSPNCPAAAEIPLMVQKAVEIIPEVKKCDIGLTFDPPWTPDKMSDDAKLMLGLF
jgi:FeS assembly SUF system protein